MAMVTPLVTVMTPVFNASDTFPWAVASILAQTYENWELIIVDDGSADPVEPLVLEIEDPRIRIFRNESNMGRGYCRSLALEKARGEYLAMVDADDWAYPHKLARQVQILGDHSHLVAVSNPVGVVDSANKLTGIRGCQNSSPMLLRGKGDLEPLGICFPATMFRMEAARNAGFRKELRAVEDRDFMIRLLAGRDYGVWGEVLYAYRQELGCTANGTWGAYVSMVRATRKLLGLYSDAFPVASRKEVFKMYTRFPLWFCRWLLAASFGLQLNRDTCPSSQQHAQFENAHGLVAGTVKRLFET